MALEEPNDTDLKFSLDGYDFVMEKEFEQVYSQFKVDYSDNYFRKGFTVTPNRGGSSC